MTVKDRLYWFFYNLVRLPFCLLIGILSPLVLIFHIFRITFFVTDGSEVLDPDFIFEKDFWEGNH